MDPIRVLLVDDNLVFLRIAAQFLREHCNGELEVVGTLSGGKAAVQEAPKLQPEVILLDLAMSDLPGLKAIPLLREALPEAHIIAVTLLDTNGYRQAALAAGAEGFVAKATIASDLLPTIRQVMGRDPCTQDEDADRRPRGD
jgi:DNA-binding NarL/FixJ family response regulator